MSPWIGNTRHGGRNQSKILFPEKFDYHSFFLIRIISMSTIQAWVATAAGENLVRQQIDLGPLGAEDVEVDGRALWHVPFGYFRA